MTSFFTSGINAASGIGKRTAATVVMQSVFGKITPINKNRGRLIDLEDGIKARLIRGL
jgi:hypothetical protein